jgi:hypothetical protein
VKERLITLKSRQETVQASGIADWKAMPWESGGSAAIVLKDRSDDGVRDQVARFLERLRADPANGVASISDRRGEIDMRSIAPTIAKLLGVPFPAAEAAALKVEP